MADADCFSLPSDDGGFAADQCELCEKRDGIKSIRGYWWCFKCHAGVRALFRTVDGYPKSQNEFVQVAIHDAPAFKKRVAPFTQDGDKSESRAARAGARSTSKADAEKTESNFSERRSEGRDREVLMTRQRSPTGRRGTVERPLRVRLGVAEGQPRDRRGIAE